MSDMSLDLEDLLERPIRSQDVLDLMHEYPALAKQLVDTTGVTTKQAAIWLSQKNENVSEEWDAAIKDFLQARLHPKHLT